MDGVISGTGQIALLNVEEEPRRGVGPAVTLLQLTVVQTVREKLRRQKTVTQTPASVRIVEYIWVARVTIYLDLGKASSSSLEHFQQ